MISFSIEWKNGYLLFLSHPSDTVMKIRLFSISLSHNPCLLISPFPLSLPLLLRRGNGVPFLLSLPGIVDRGSPPPPPPSDGEPGALPFFPSLKSISNKFIVSKLQLGEFFPFFFSLFLLGSSLSPSPFLPYFEATRLPFPSQACSRRKPSVFLLSFFRTRAGRGSPSPRGEGLSPFLFTRRTKRERSFPCTPRYEKALSGEGTFAGKDPIFSRRSYIFSLSLLVRLMKSFWVFPLFPR